MNNKEIHAQFMAHALGALIGRQDIQMTIDERAQRAMSYANAAFDFYRKRWPDPERNEAPNPYTESRI